MIKVLVVDDSRVYHRFIAEKLGNNHLVIPVFDSRIAIDEIEKAQPDIILIDMEMPYITGLELSVLINKNVRIRAIPVIIMTGSYSEKLITAAIKSYAMDILPKSSHEVFLVHKIDGIIKQKEMIEQDAKNLQLESIKALIASMNHNINNALQISNSTLSKCFKIADDEIYPSLKKIEECNERIKLVIKKLNSLNSVILEDYTEDVSMLKF